MRGTDNKQFFCTHPGCDKVFNRRDYLERHAANHLKVKPFVCVQCNRQFSRKDLYDNHLTTKRHARVVLETQRAIFDTHETETQPVNTLPSQPIHSIPASNLYRRDTPSDQFRSRLEDMEPPGLPEYAPPLTQPPYFSGPGPGTQPHNFSLNIYEADDQMGPQSYALKAQNGYQIYPESDFIANDSMHPYVQEAKNNTADKELDMYWFNQYNKAPSVISRHEPENYLRSETGSQSGRFSAYGVSLGLSGSTTTPSTQSDGSVREDYSDTDGSNSAAIVGDRIRHDMAHSPHSYANLRESPFSSCHGLDDNTNDDQSIKNDSNVENSSNTISSKPMRSSTTEQDSRSSESSLEAVLSITGDKRYTWFFDDIFETEKAKVGYDHCYSDAIKQYQFRSEEYAWQHPELATTPVLESSNHKNFHHCLGGKKSVNLSQFSNIFKPLNVIGVKTILSILNEIPTEIDSMCVVDQWIQTAWTQAEAVRYIVHPATFDANSFHPSIVSVLALLGMALSEDASVSGAARRAYAPVFLYAYDSLNQIPNNMIPSRLDAHTVNILQAFALLLRFERLILIGDGTQVSFTRNSPGRYATDLFLGKALSLVTHSGEFSSPSKQPIWATVSSESYLFHQGADPDCQWREWSLIEALKRTVHFSLYCDSIAALSSSKPNPVSIFNMDIHMVCPDTVWQSRSSNEFFYIFGHSEIVTNVPYLGLIKSLIRFPRVAQNDDLSTLNRQLPPIRAPWSIFALKTVAHGLISIVGKLSGLIPHGDEMLQAVMHSRANAKNGSEIFSKIDRQLQARLYRGLDVWYHYFSVAYGDVTDQILKVNGSMGIPLRDEFDVTFQESKTDFRESIPQYALIIVLCHYSSFIFVHEDLPVVLQVTSNIKDWFDNTHKKSLQALLDHLYMPLYTSWINTDEAKGMVSACTLYIAWTHAIAGNVNTENHMFLSAMIYISVIVVWLYDFATNDTSAEVGKLRLNNFEFIDDAIDHIHAVHKHISGQGPRPVAKSSSSVLLLGACLLHKRKSTKALVEVFIKLIRVMDSTYSSEELVNVIKKSTEMYEERITKVMEAMRISNDNDEESGTTSKESTSSTTSNNFEDITATSSSRDESNSLDSDADSQMAQVSDLDADDVDDDNLSEVRNMNALIGS